MEASRSSPSMQNDNGLEANSEANMEDVPLNNINPLNSMPDLRHVPAPKSKVGTLRRFFKMKSKSEKDNSEDVSDVVINERNPGASSPGGTKRKHGFGLLSSSNMRFDNKKDNNGDPGPSKPTLKASISTYWNNLFKKKKLTAASKSPSTPTIRSIEDEDININIDDHFPEDKKVQQAVEKYITESAEKDKARNEKPVEPEEPTTPPQSFSSEIDMDVENSNDVTSPSDADKMDENSTENRLVMAAAKSFDISQ